MIRRSWTRTASIEETLALWAVSLREIKKQIRPLFRQERVATNAGLFLEGLLCDEQRKTGCMSAGAAGDHGPCVNNAKPVGFARSPLAILALGGNRRSWVAEIGMPMRCVISSAIMSSSIWQMTMRS